jgi:dTDP-4-dehydrorhamnose 3,5-epimerase
MKITVLPTRLAGVKIIEPKVFGDARGFLMETFNRAEFAAAGIEHDFVQDNHSRSVRGTLRGLHFQAQQPQGKLVRAVRGEIFDVAVDLRRESPTFGEWIGVTLSEANKRQLWIPPRFAHGFCALEDATEVVYKCTEYYAPEHERTLLWSDPELDIAWPALDPVLSPKDEKGLTLTELFPSAARSAYGEIGC